MKREDLITILLEAGFEVIKTFKAETPIYQKEDLDTITISETGAFPFIDITFTKKEFTKDNVIKAIKNYNGIKNEVTQKAFDEIIFELTRKYKK